MSVSKDLMNQALAAFVMAFGPSKAMALELPPEKVADVWHGLFAKEDEAAFRQAVRQVLLTVREFPVPADVAAALAEGRATAEPEQPKENA